MDEQTYLIKFEGVSAAYASRYADELKNMILEAARDVKVDRRRDDTRTQDFGATLVLILGTPAVIAVAKAVGDWLRLRQSASITIENSDGKTTAKNLTSKDAYRLAELLHAEK